jgi:hypothetical protein
MKRLSREWVKDHDEFFGPGWNAWFGHGTQVLRGLVPVRMRSSRQTGKFGLSEGKELSGFWAASQPSGDKSPRHSQVYSMSKWEITQPRHAAAG